MRSIVLVSFMCGLVVAALIMAIAWEHNPQGEFHRDGIIYWEHWILLGVLWGVPASMSIFSLLFVLKKALSRKTKGKL